MKTESTLLIVSDEEQAWRFDCPVLFLGEWCLRQNRKHIWGEMNYVIASPYGLGINSKDEDFKLARQLEKSIFPIIANTLNQFHGVSYDERLWKIIAGHWFRRYIELIVNRINTLKQCLEQHNPGEFITYRNIDNMPASLSSASALVDFEEGSWNNILSAKILTHLKTSSIKINYIDKKFNLKNYTKASLKKRFIKGFYINYIQDFIFKTFKRNEVFILNSYLSSWGNFQFLLSFFQLPYFTQNITQENIPRADLELRKKLTSESENFLSNPLEKFIVQVLFQILPINYLEGFSYLNHMAEKNPWPERPKHIFTSNNFDTDDLFKIWTTKKINGGAKYYIGQHGNNYGTHRYMNPSIEEETADKFFTWGWKGELKQHIPMFIFKTVGMAKGSYNRQQKKLLLIQLPLGNRCNTWDNYAEYSKYIDDQVSFISNLNQNCKTELIVRMHSASKHVEWGGYAKFREFDRNLQIDDGNSRIQKLIAESRYVVYSYDSTGMLETLSLNIPTLAFWQNGLDHLRESAKPYYKLLIDAEIIHLSPESLAKKLNSIWDDAQGIWWKSESVQYARHRFCEQYARELSNPIQALKAEFIS